MKNSYTRTDTSALLTTRTARLGLDPNLESIMNVMDLKIWDEMWNENLTANQHWTQPNKTIRLTRPRSPSQHPRKNCPTPHLSKMDLDPRTPR